MQCKQCQSQKLILIPWGQFEYLCDFVAGQWVYRDPGAQAYYFSSRKVSVRCLDCHHDESGNFPDKIYSPRITQEEITFDLDHTLFYCELKEYEHFAPDFCFTSPDEKYTYGAAKRPHLDELIKFCLQRFKKINFFTAATDWYGAALVKSLNIPPAQMGYFKHRGDTQNERPLSFDWEYMKPMNNSLMVEDKPLVVKGYNNRIIKVAPFFPGGDDRELLRVMDLIQKPDEEFSRPQKLTGEIKLFLQNLTMTVKEIPESVIYQVLRLPTLTQAEIDKMPVHTSPHESYWTLDNNKISVNLVGLNFVQYQELMKLIGDYTDVKVLTKIKFNRLVKDWANYHRRF